MNRLFRSRLLLVTLIALLTVSIVPLVFIGVFGLNSYETRAQEIINTSSTLLDEASLERMESLGANTAAQVGSFLRQRDFDILQFADLPRTEEAYLAFAQSHQDEFWSVDGFTNEELRVSLGLYKELAFIGVDGQEILKLENDCFPYPIDCQYVSVAEADLNNVSDPRNTTYQTETYFEMAQTLDQGDIFVGRPIGRYVPISTSFKGAQFLAGERYQGIIRFLTPVYEDDERIGYVMLALDHTHILNFIEHLDPTSARPLPAVDSRTDNIVYIIGANGDAIAHVQHENIAGVDSSGEPVAPFTADNRFGGPGNFNEMGFLSPVFPNLMEQSLNRSQGTIGQFEIQSGNDVLERSLTYSVIPYFTGDNYSTNRGFGLVIVSTDYNARSVETDVLATQLQNDLDELLGNLGGLLSILIAGVAIAAILFAQGVVAPVRAITQYARKVETQGGLAEDEIEALKSRRGGGEVNDLARTFGTMAETVKKREAEISQLLSQSDEALKERIKDLNALEEVGQQLTSTLNLDTVLDLTTKALLEQTGAESVQILVYPEENVEDEPLLRQAGKTISKSETTGTFIVPLTVGKNEIGQFTLTAAQHEFVESERVLARQLADWVSVAVNNARLFEFTQKQQAELELRNQEVVEANRLKSEFLATMSHELRTPLNAIIGFVGIIMMSGDLNERNTFLAKRARTNSKRLLELINDILDISRIEAGRFKLFPTEVKIKNLVIRVEDQVEVLAEEKDLTLDIHVAQDIPESIMIDEDGITKVLTNLMSNAVKFTEEGSIALNISRQDDELLIDVADTGIGIPAHMQEVIFESFRQVDGSATRVYGGSGLGLSIVKHICDAMHGTITLDSTLGEGTTFHVRLPLELVPEKE